MSSPATGPSLAQPTSNAHRTPLCPTTPDNKDDNNNNDKRELRSEPGSSGTYDLPPAPNALQIQKAGKKTAQEEARREASNARPTKFQLSAPNRAKGKQRANPPHESSLAGGDESDESDEDEVSVIHQIFLFLFTAY